MENYRIIKQPDYNFKKSNEYFRECEKDNRPFIVIRQKVKYCELHWDHITIRDFSADPEFNNRIKDIMMRHWRTKKRYFYFGSVASIYKLSLEEAIQAAEEIYNEFEGLKEVIK